MDAQGVADLAVQVPSPNCDQRPLGAEISLLVVHGISLPPGRFGGDGVTQLFTNMLDPRADPYYAGIAHLRVSSHFFLHRDGRLVQYVPCGMRAWHAGVSSWRGRPACNDYSVGIELEGTDDLPYESAQYHLLARLARALCARYPVRDMVGHCHVAPGRKSDPGVAFDWTGLAQLLGVGPTDGHAAVRPK
ncbi:MAG: 1,6-anhydro-N-acetylmuramyl-L-alanine amidase AmpD [Betaproteobacteria bacterium]